jgi:hypothetical protein
MHSSLFPPSIDADETIPEAGFASISEMIAETLITMSEGQRDETAWPNVLSPKRVARDVAFTKTF